MAGLVKRGNSSRKKKRRRPRAPKPRRRRAGPAQTPKKMALIMMAFGGRCALCGVRVQRTNAPAPDQATIDHIKPRSRGGSSDMSNLQLACAACNMDKGNTMPEQYVPRLKRAQEAT